MATTAELKNFANLTSFAIPTIDYQVGVPASLTALKSFSSLVRPGSGVTYDAATKILHVKADGLSLSGYDFRGVTVSIEASNVAIRNSKFDASFGVYSIIQTEGRSGLTLDHNSFDGLKLNKSFADFVHGGDGKVTITYNQFLNAPTDAIFLRSGVVDHNYFSGAGYKTGAHADAIWIDGTTGPITITNNFIDARKMSDALAEPTSAISIGNYFGDNHAIVVSKNVLLGGAYTVYVTDSGKYDYTKVTVTDNLVDHGLFGDLYPNRQPPELSYSGNDAATHLGGGSLPPPVPAPNPDINTNPVGYDLIRGTAGTDHVFGDSGNDILIGGGGRDFLFGGKGADIFRYESVRDSAPGARDVIGDFQAGLDKIDIHALASQSGPLHFLGEAAFNGAAGAVHVVGAGHITAVEVDLNGDRVADFRIDLLGQHHLSAIDFIL